MYYTHNEIKTNEGYLADGWKAEEVELIREADILFNEHVDNGYKFATEEKENRYHELLMLLGEE